MDHSKQILRALERITPVEAHNRLMASPDRDVALAMLYMNDEERDSVLSRVAPVKAARVREELLLQERLQITQDQYEMTVENLVARVSRSSRPRSVRSYIRPRRRRP